MRGTPLAFTGCGLDRADYLRADPARLAELAGPDARLLRLDRLIPLLGEAACLQWGRCGGPTRIAKGGWQRDCTSEACAAQHFPRVDPVTIMLVEHDGRLLLGRNSRFPEGSYSALAGFVEPGESIEEAVAREVFEEAGVRASDVTYIASQPWPFPSQLMIACHAHAEDGELTIDETELEDARWFTRDEVRDALENGAESRSFRAPTPQAIARHMLHWWLEQER